MQPEITDEGFPQSDITALPDSQSQLQYNRTLLMQLNARMFIQLLPAVVYLVLLMLVGTVGNSLALYVFGWRLKPTTQNVLFMWLAVFDLLSCVVGMPSEMVDIRNYYLYEDEAACKVMRFLLTVPSIASVNLLLVIAVDRYRRVCRPLHDQINRKHAKWCVLASAIIAVVLAGPALSLYGKRTIIADAAGLKGCDCSVQDKYQGRLYPLLYELVFGVSFVVYTVALAAMYLRIWLEIRRHRKYMSRHSIPSIALMSLLKSDTDSQNSVVTETTPDFCRRTKRKRSSEATENPDVSRRASRSLQSEASTDKSKGARKASQKLQPDIAELSEISRRTTTSRGAARESTNGVQRSSHSLKGHSKVTAPEINESEGSEAKSLNSKRVFTVTNQDQESEVTEGPHVPLSNCSEFDGAGSKDSGSRGSLFTVSETTYQLPDVSRESAQTQLCDAATPERANVSRKASRNLTDSSEVCLRKESRFPTAQLSVKILKSLKANKLTVIALTVTLVFVISYLPHLCLIILRTVVDDFDHQQSGARLVLYNIFLRSYFVNSVANVFVYSAMNTEFRTECKAVFRRLFCCLRKIQED